MRLSMRFALAAALAATAAGHGAVTYPKPRNAVDFDSPVSAPGAAPGPWCCSRADPLFARKPWNGPVPRPVPFEWFCAFPLAGSTEWHNISAANAQACFW